MVRFISFFRRSRFGFRMNFGLTKLLNKGQKFYSYSGLNTEHIGNALLYIYPPDDTTQ